MFNFKRRDYVEDAFGERGRVVEVRKNGVIVVRMMGENCDYCSDELYLVERPAYDEDDLPEQVSDEE